MIDTQLDLPVLNRSLPETVQYNSTITDEIWTLKCWKAYESRFPKLALLAKRSECIS